MGWIDKHIDDFLDSINNVRSRNTLLAYKKNLNNFARELGDNIFSSENIQKYLNLLEGSASTKHSAKTAIKQLNQYLISKDILSKDFTVGIKIPKIEERINKMSEKIEEDKIYNYFDKNSKNSTRDITIAKILLNTGCRIIEVLNLKKKDINLEENSIDIINSKGNKSRRVYMNESLKKQFSIFDISKLNKDDLIFPISYVTWNSKMRELSKKLGFEIRSHDTRRFYASKLNDKGVTTSNICSILGHDSIETTQRYIKMFEENKKNIMMNV